VSANADNLLSSPKVRCAHELARQYPGDLVHMEQVARLSNMLFHALQAVHGLGNEAAELLYCAALLHDVGISVGFVRHHKHSQDIILKSDLPALTADERRVVAAVARYHRKAKPRLKHAAFRSLEAGQRELVRKLAAILRPADGLDREHENAVSALDAREERAGLWVVTISGGGDLDFAVHGAARKARMFEKVYGVALRFEPKRLRGEVSFSVS
jgi:exopolyphosphatase/guanosine-5'-triphosphate,3'-diphosphate pyrophosphatase